MSNPKQLKPPYVAYIGHYHCSAHNFHALIVDDFADAGGTRILGGKCCGRWDLVHRWAVKPDQIEELHNCLLGEQENAERERKSPR